MDAPGSVLLDEEQQKVWLERRGQHYIRIAENPLRPSRRVRRALRFRGAARNLSQQDVALLRIQGDLRAQLLGLKVKPVL